MAAAEEITVGQTYYGEHAEGFFLAVPGMRLPHEEPFAANGKKGDQPHQQRKSQRHNSRARGSVEGD
jgi:hypothetical protein